MGTFDEMLASLHPNSEGVPQGATLTDADNKVITIDAKRRFVVPEGYNLDLAYEGDVNSQIVTFCLPKTYEGHDLVGCNIKGIKWKNKVSSNEDWSELVPMEKLPDWVDKKTVNDYQFLQWIVPPAAFTKAGTLEVGISLYDFQDNKLAFSWNTAIFTGFTIQSTITDVGYKNEAAAYIAPAKNEILSINEETHSIVAPAGYNFTFSVYGSKNTAIIYFQAPAALGGMNILDSTNKITILVKLGNRIKSDTISFSNIRSSFYNTQETGNGLVEFDWLVPDWITSNGSGYTGTITISLIVENADKTKIWKTAPFAKLMLGKGEEDISGQTLSANYYTIIDAQFGERPVDNKTISGIVSFKQMTEAEWTNSTYVPDINEMIIYAADIDHVNPRIKFGNGTSLANDLPFAIDPTIPAWARKETFDYTYELSNNDIEKITNHFLEVFEAAEDYEG